MKFTALPFYAFISLLAAAPATTAQLAPPAGAPSATLSPVIAPAKKISSLKIAGESTMAGAVSELLEAMKSASLPELNVLYAPGAAEIVLPELNLRNVAGPDALRLIAVSANCEAEPISDAQNQNVIGYLVRPKAEAIDPTRRVASSYRAGSKPMLPGKVSLNPATSKAKPPTIIGEETVAVWPEGKSGALPGGSAAESVLFLGESSPAVRIYPLRTVTTVVKFNEIEETLRDLLTAGGIAPDAAKFALHEKTNVLVVTGSQRVHELVGELINALQTNQVAAEGANNIRDTALREVTEMRVRVEAADAQNARLNNEFAKVASELRDLRMESETLAQRNARLTDERKQFEEQRKQLEDELRQLKARTAKP